jgi:hypothetical protein
VLLQQHQQHCFVVVATNQSCFIICVLFTIYYYLVSYIRMPFSVIKSLKTEILSQTLHFVNLCRVCHLIENPFVLLGKFRPLFSNCVGLNFINIFRARFLFKKFVQSQNVTRKKVCMKNARV